MGNPIDPEVFVEHEGRKINFCCKSCIEEFKKDPAKYLTKLEST
jgi:YHS domain-containing protein